MNVYDFVQIQSQIIVLVVISHVHDCTILIAISQAIATQHILALELHF